MDQDATNDSPRAQPPAKHSWSLFYNCPLVKIVVGPERETFHVSRDLLIAHSPVMAAALTGKHATVMMTYFNAIYLTELLSQ